jgi:hypothetical protein
MRSAGASPALFPPFLSHLFTAASPKATTAAAMVAVRGHGPHPTACPWSRQSSRRLPFYLSSLLLFSSPPSYFCFLSRTEDDGAEAVAIHGGSEEEVTAPPRGPSPARARPRLSAPPSSGLVARPFDFPSPRHGLRPWRDPTLGGSDSTSRTPAVFSFPHDGKTPATRGDSGRSLPVFLLVRVRVTSQKSNSVSAFHSTRSGSIASA